MGEISQHGFREDDVVVIIRARTAEQPEGTLAELDEGPLDEALVSELDDLWEGIRHDAPVDRVFEIGQSKDVKISQVGLLGHESAELRSSRL